MKHTINYSVAIHCMLLLALYGRSTKLTSKRIALSTGCNAVTIRTIFQRLQQAGLICVKRGTGGAQLTKAASDISLWDIYYAVAEQDDCTPLQLHPNPYAQCPVGKCIHEVLAEPYACIATAMRQQMQAYTLQMLMDRYTQLQSPPAARAGQELDTGDTKL